MKWKMRSIMICLFAGLISVIFAENVRAEKIFSEELTRIFGFNEEKCYLCGDSTEDGVVQLKTNATSLEEGEIIDVQVIYNSSKSDVDLDSSFSMEMLYDTEVLEYVDYKLSDEHILKYSIIVHPESGDGAYEEEFVDSSYRINLLTLTFYQGKKIFDEDGCMATFRYKIKKKTDAVRIYGMPKVVTHSGSKYFTNENGEYVADILTLNITDSASVPAKDSTLTLTTTPTQGTTDITVPINIEKNDGFNLLGLTLDYDPALFTYEALEIDDALKSKISLDSVYEAPGSGRIKASFIALDDITDLGSFLKLKLKVKDGVSPGTNSNVGVEITQVGNKAETAMEGNGTTCVVSITGTTTGEEETPAPGDVNADKKIDLVDAVYILQNYNQVREFTNVQKTVADVDKNGTVNLVDALMIMKYFNGEITAF